MVSKAGRDCAQKFEIPVRITHINFSDGAGGHGRAAYRLHTGLRRLGHDSRLLALQKDSQASDVYRFEPPAVIPARVRRVFLRHYLARRQAALASRVVGSRFMSDGRSEHNADVLRQALPCDVLHLHWVSGAFDYVRFFRQLPCGQRLVWTLHDMSPFTGGCDYVEECERYRERCGACPALGAKDENDLTAQVWRWKWNSYAPLNPDLVRLVAPSRWMADEIKKSSLMGRFPISVIPNGLDTDQFQPRDQKFARQLLGIPQEAKVLLFLAERAGSKRKGMDLLHEALGGLRDIPEIYSLLVGHGASLNGTGIPGLATGLLRDDISLSAAYSAADVFAIPSMEENLPNTGLESLACGIPIVAFATGGLPDIVRHGETGLLVPRGDVGALRQALAELLQNHERRTGMAMNCRRVALQEYSLDVQAKRYVALYESMGREQKPRPAA
jgi:glycosyltransferase involved in cell wall biosynthesis